MRCIRIAATATLEARVKALEINALRKEVHQLVQTRRIIRKGVCAIADHNGISLPFARATIDQFNAQFPRLS